MYKIRIHSRGGQGGRASAHILGTAAFLDGKHVQDFALYGAERRGAPLTAFCRIDDKPVLERGYIKEPDCVLIFDDSLLAMKEVHAFDGLNPRGMVIVNTKKKNIKLPVPRTVKVHTLDATQIGQRNIGKPIPGTAMIGAFVKLTKLFDLTDVYRAVDKVLRKKYKDIINHNIVAVKEGYEAV